MGQRFAKYYPVIQSLTQQVSKSRVTQFDEATGTEAAVTAVITVEIHAFTDDSVPLRSELLQQQLPIENYALLPQQPLTCDAYGLILPADDQAWQNQVNEFRSEKSIQIRDQWLAANVAEQVTTVKYGFDQKSEF